VEITSVVKEDFLTFSNEDTFSSVIGKMRKFEKKSGLVFRNNKYIGLIVKKKLLRTKIDTTEAKINQFVQKTPILNEHADIIEAAYLMYLSNLDFLPVERNKKIFGVLDALDLVKLCLGLSETKSLNVSDIKIIKSKKINKDDFVSTVVDLMYKERLDQVPIFEKGELYGIITYRDLMRKYLNWSPRRDISAKFNKMASSRSAEVDMPNLANLPVSSFSTNDNLLTIGKGDKLNKAIEIMIKNGISNLILMDGNEFLGMLTVKNILRKIGSLKIPKNFNIKFIGLNEVKLKPYQKYNIKKITANEAFKIQRQVHNEFFLNIHLKEYEKDGNRQKYSVNLRVEFPGQIITSTQEDWDVETALRKTFNNAKNKLKKKFRGDSSWRKYYE